MAEVLGPRQIAPLLGRRQLVRLQVARVPHDSVACQRLAVVQALRVVERVVADLGGRGRIARLGRGGQQLVARQHLEGIGRAGPHDVGTLALGQLAHIGHGSRGVLVQDLDLDPRIGRLEGLLVGRGQLLGKRGQHRHRAGLGRHGGAPQSCGHGGRQPSALLHRCLLGLLCGQSATHCRQRRPGRPIIVSDAVHQRRRRSGYYLRVCRHREIPRNRCPAPDCCTAANRNNRRDAASPLFPLRPGR